VLPVRPRGKPRSQPAGRIPASGVGQSGPVIIFYAAVLICDDRVRGDFAPAAGRSGQGLSPMRRFSHAHRVTAVATAVLAAKELASARQGFVKVKTWGKHPACLFDPNTNASWKLTPPTRATLRSLDKAVDTTPQA
jgi:hypothetical protein